MLQKAIAFVQLQPIAFLVLVATMRLIFLAANGLDLLGDESYYWDWSRRPDWCYFSKPPMVAWLIGVFTYLMGDSTFVVRLPAVILGSIFLYYFFCTARLLYGEKTAAFALLVILATPINLLANFLMTIDPPLYCFWIMSLFYLIQGIFEEQKQAWWRAGFSTAAAVMSKQVALFIPVMAVVFVFAHPVLRSRYKLQIAYYLLPVFVAISILFIWNMQHHWVMFGHSQGHFANHEGDNLLKHLQHARDFWFYQLLLINPAVFVAVLITGVIALIQFSTLSLQQRFLWLMGPGLLLTILLLSFTRKMQGNWPMPFYFAAILLLLDMWRYENRKRFWHWALGVGFTMVLLTSTLPLVLGLFNLQKTRWDPTNRFKSWQPVAAQIYDMRYAVQSDLENTFTVALGHRSIASQLAFYLPDHPKVFRFQPSGIIESQYEVWGGPSNYIGKNAFIIGKVPVAQLPVQLTTAFASVRLLGQINDPNRIGEVFYLYFAEHLNEWPLKPLIDAEVNSNE